MTINLPVRVVRRTDANGDIVANYIVDGEGDSISLEDIAAALNATQPAPDLTALREAVETWRAKYYAITMADVVTNSARWREVVQADNHILRAALAMFPLAQDGDA